MSRGDAHSCVQRSYLDCIVSEPALFINVSMWLFCQHHQGSPLLNAFCPDYEPKQQHTTKRRMKETKRRMKDEASKKVATAATHRNSTRLLVSCRFSHLGCRKEEKRRVCHVKLFKAVLFSALDREEEARSDVPRCAIN